MKGGSNRQTPAGTSNPAPLSPTSKGTAKYTNKDGSKYITVLKGSTSADSSQPSPTGVPAATAKNSVSGAGPVAGAGSNGPTQPVNRKKQKRRAKAAAKAAAEQALTGNLPTGLPSPPASQARYSGDAEVDSQDDDEHDADEDPQHSHPQPNGHTEGSGPKGKKSRKKKKKGGASTEGSRDQEVPLAQDNAPSGMSRERIWNTSSQEERERIKEFWLGLSEKERKALVKVEKDAVLKKMKEQQKHTCSCTVCGRKRTAIEEELEGLYDAYYEELEQYANHPSQVDSSILPPVRYSHPHSHPSSYSNHQPSRGHIVEHAGDDEDDGEDDEYSEDELEDDDYSEEEPLEDTYRDERARDFFSFGNSLTVQGGILTVADDLLKNDGKKFIEMMEQLAERRMAREEDARAEYSRDYSHADGADYGHSHSSTQDGGYDEEDDEYEEDEEDYDSQEDEDHMTEEQRMEEGRRMFQIFAARMFEQRVLTAYREKVAKERQQTLLQELDDEEQKAAKRAEKKARDAQKRKDKAARKKEALAEEKARKEATKAAEEAARQAEEARKAEEQRRKAEEKKKKREAQKKLEEEERQRKEIERLRRTQEREENERKAREAKEREKRMREETRQKERELREQKEREARDRREQQERDKREKEAKAKAAREAKEAAKEAKEREKEKLKQEERAAQKAAALAAVPVPITLTKRPAQHQAPAAVPALPQQFTSSYASPQISVATPALPKAPTPMRVRQPSQHESTAGASSQSGSAPSQNPSPHPITPVHASPGPIMPSGKPGIVGGPHAPSHPASPPSTAAKPLFPQPSSFGVPPPMGGMVSYPPGIPAQIPQALSAQMPPGFGSPTPRDPIYGASLPQAFRPPPNLAPAPPGFGGPVAGRGFPVQPPPGFSGSLDLAAAGMGQQVFGPPIAKEPTQSHSRQGSGSFEPGTPASQPIGRPAPIGRPSSIVHGQRPPSGSPGTLSKVEGDSHLGSSALIDDFDEPLKDFPGRLARSSMHSSTPGARPLPAFGMSSFGNMESIFQPQSNPWGPPNTVPQGNIFSPPPPPGFGAAPMSTAWGPSPGTSTFGGPGMMDRPSEPRYVAIRKLLCRVCEELSANLSANDSFVRLDDVKAQLMAYHADVGEKELQEICETEGNHQNGGGTFDLREDSSGRRSIRWDHTNGRANHRLIQRAVGAPGEISSPMVGGNSINDSI